METKQILLNPALLRVSDKTRKNKTQRNSNSISSSERSERSKAASANLVKKQILNKIRKNYRDPEKYNSDRGGNIDNEDIPIHTDEFESSVQYFNNLKKKMEIQSSSSKSIPETIIPQQYTPSISTATTPFAQPDRYITKNAPEGYVPSDVGSSTAPNCPQYGCLKGGKLPTFRNWQKTQKNPKYYNNFAPTTTSINNVNLEGGVYYNKPSFIESSSQTLVPASHTNIENIIENKGQPSDWQKKKERIHQIIEQRKAVENAIDVAQKSLPTRKRKITRRTYHVGKSKIHPKVSVLLSNKTLRSKIMTEKQHYNEIPINDIKQYLQKKGLIKIGSNSPNHLLRSMYENAMLLGDVVNHNKDTLLHNFLKGGEDEK